jgi:hypothetical protein
MRQQQQQPRPPPAPQRRAPPSPPATQVSSEVVEKIKRVPVLVQRLKALKEVNVEFLVVDSRTVVTDHPLALVKLMGARAGRGGLPACARGGQQRDGACTGYLPPPARRTGAGRPQAPSARRPLA